MAKDATPPSGDGSPTGPFRGSHRALLAEVSDMVTVSDREGRILYANPATESVTGRTPEQFAAMRPFETIHPEDRPRCEEAFERLAGEPGLSLEIEHRFRHKDGSWRWVEGTFRSLFEDPEVGGLVATARDITERKRAEEALRGSEERLQLALDASAMGTFTYYPEEDRSEPDARMLELFGLPEDGVLNLAAALETMIHPEDGERYAEAVARSTDPAGSGELREEIRLIHPDGSEHWVSVMARVFFEGERPRRMVGNAMDVTERKRAEEVLRESEERQAFLLKLSDAIRPLAHPVEIQRTAMDVVAGHLGIASAVYFDIDPDGDRAAVQEGYKSARIAFPSSVRISDFGSFMPGDFRKGETISYEDAETDPRLEAQRDTFRALGIRAGVGVPLVKARRLAAMLAINHTQPRRWTHAELRWLEEVAERTWSAVERARAEDALRESEEKYRMLVENVGGHAVFLLDADGLVTEWTASARRVKGYSAEEVIGRHLSQFCTPEEIEAGEPGRELAEAAETGRAEREAWRVKKGGERIWVNEVATAVRNDDGELVGFAKIARDLTERMRAEEALRESEERYRLAVEAADLGRWELVPDTGKFHTSSTCNRHLGLPEDAQPTHEGHFEHIHPDDHAMIHERLGRAFQEGGEFEVEYRVIHTAGGVRRILSRARMLHNSGSTPDRLTGITLDVTEARELEEERERARARELTALAEAAERERISRELHDRVAHHMGVAHQSLELFSALREADPDRAAERLDLARETTRVALDQTRALSAELKRLQEEELEEGIGAALRALGETMSDGVAVEVSVRGDDSGVPKPVALQAYLAMREAIRNAIRHAGGSRVGVALDVADGEVVGLVEDDGGGFDPEAVGKASPSWGVGLRSMRERAEMLGGSLRVGSAPGAGTRVEIKVPLDGRRP